MTIPLVLCGAALVAVAVLWRLIARRRVRRRLHALLLDRHAQVRVNALDLVAVEGVQHFMLPLFRMCATERDPFVLDKVEHIILQHPSVAPQSRDLLRLLSAVQQRRESNEAHHPPEPGAPAEDAGSRDDLTHSPLVTSLLDVTPSVLLTPNRRVTPHLGARRSAVAAARTPRVRGRQGAAQEVSATPRRDAARQSEPAGPQVQEPIMVTGAGGPAGVAVIRALLAAGQMVIALDSDPSAVGLRLAPLAAVVPRGDDPGFVDELCTVAARWGAVAVIPTVAEELTAVFQGRDQLASAGLASWVPDPASVQRCLDKWSFYKTMADAGIAVPPTALGSGVGVPGPWIVKPRFGRGSRDVYVVEDPAGLDYVLGQVPDPLVQTRVTGREFTVDVLADAHSRVLAAVPRWRVETKAGISTKGITFQDAAVVAVVGRVVGALRLTGPANVQGFVSHGSPVVIEVNPRFSGGLPLSLAAGADLVGQYLNGVLGHPIDPERLRFRPDASMFRYHSEVFEG